MVNNTRSRMLALYRTALTITTLFVLIQTPLIAGVYKWVDEDGQVHYGEKPGNTSAERVTIRQNETTKPRPINTKEKDEAAEKASTKPAEPEAPKYSKKQKRQWCNEAKSDLATIASRGRMREISAKGEYTYLSEAQKQQRIKAAKKKQREFCG